MPQDERDPLNGGIRLERLVEILQQGRGRLVAALSRVRFAFGALFRPAKRGNLVTQSRHLGVESPNLFTQLVNLMAQVLHFRPKLLGWGF